MADTKYTMTTLCGKPCYVIPCDEFDAMKATPPADAALADALKDYQEALGLLFIDGSSVTIPSGSTAHKQLRLIVEAARLRALSQPATVAQVPEGFVLVPVEPTNRMMIAGAGSWVGWQESSMHDYLPTPDEVRDVYCAMLAASQSATGGA